MVQVVDLAPAEQKTTNAHVINLGTPSNIRWPKFSLVFSNIKVTGACEGEEKSLELKVHPKNDYFKNHIGHFNMLYVLIF